MANLIIGHDIVSIQQPLNYLEVNHETTNIFTDGDIKHVSIRDELAIAHIDENEYVFFYFNFHNCDDNFTKPVHIQSMKALKNLDVGNIIVYLEAESSHLFICRKEVATIVEETLTKVANSFDVKLQKIHHTI